MKLAGDGLGTNEIVRHAGEHRGGAFTVAADSALPGLSESMGGPVLRLADALANSGAVLGNMPSGAMGPDSAGPDGSSATTSGEVDHEFPLGQGT